MTDAEWAEASRLITGYFPTARSKQRPPAGDWWLWVMMAGRGFGKTRSGTEWLVERALTDPGDYFLAAPTFHDMRAIAVEGARSGLLAVLRRRTVPHTWNLSSRQVTLGNGSMIQCGSAEDGDRWRGYNFKGGWCDELGAWRYPDSFTQIRLATRIGDRPQIVATTTPRRSSALVKDLVLRDDPRIVVTPGSTWENEAHLSDSFLDEMRRAYGGTTIGRQELEGELLLDIPGALWTPDLIEAARVDAAPAMSTVVVGVDPAVTSGEDADLTGIVAVGRDGDDFYVLDDRSSRLSPDGTARTAIGLLDELEGDRIVGEVNNGGDYIGTVIRHADRQVAYRSVRASRGKVVRAQPVASLYEQGRVHHVGHLPELEEQLCQWTPDDPGSPDRMDALVWAVTDLGESVKRRPRVVVR